MEARKCRLEDGSSLIIREARQQDAAELLEFLPRTFDETDYLIMTRPEFDKTLDQEADFLGKVAASKTQLALVAHLDDELVGLLTFIGRDLERVRHTGEVGVIVSQSHWGRGVGRNLMLALHSWARANPLITKIDLRVRLSNRRAITLYEDLGYQVEGWIRRAVCVDGVYDDHYWMGLELPLEH